MCASSVIQRRLKVDYMYFARRRLSNGAEGNLTFNLYYVSLSERSCFQQVVRVCKLIISVFKTLWINPLL